jgi:hypothetical protein
MMKVSLLVSIVFLLAGCGHALQRPATPPPLVATVSYGPAPGAYPCPTAQVVYLTNQQDFPVNVRFTEYRKHVPSNYVTTQQIERQLMSDEVIAIGHTYGDVQPCPYRYEYHSRQVTRLNTMALIKSLGTKMSAQDMPSCLQECATGFSCAHLGSVNNIAKPLADIYRRTVQQNQREISSAEVMKKYGAQADACDREETTEVDPSTGAFMNKARSGKECRITAFGVGDTALVVPPNLRGSRSLAFAKGMKDDKELVFASDAEAPRIEFGGTMALMEGEVGGAVQSLSSQVVNGVEMLVIQTQTGCLDVPL